MSIHNIDFTLGPFTLEWQSFPGTDFENVSVLNSDGQIIEDFEDCDAHLAEELQDWLNAKHEGKHSPMPFWYKDLLKWRAREEAFLAAMHDEPAQSFDDYNEDDIPF